MSTTPAKITLRSSDGELFEVDEAVAVQSQAIKHLIDDQCADNVVPLPNVTGPILAKVIQYCKKHAEAGDTNDGDAKPADESLTNWDADFINVDQVTLVDLILVNLSLPLQKPSSFSFPLSVVFFFFFDDSFFGLFWNCVSVNCVLDGHLISLL